MIILKDWLQMFVILLYHDRHEQSTNYLLCRQQNKIYKNHIIQQIFNAYL